MATFWGRKKKVYQSGLVLALPDAYQMGENFSKPFIKSAFSCSTTWEGKFFAAKARFLVILVAYLLREEKYFFKRLNFRFFSWSTPWGRKFRSRHNFWPLQVGTSEEIFKTEVKKRVSRCLPFEGTKLFSKHPPKWLLPLGISEEKNNFLEPAHFELSRWLLFEGRKLFRKAPTKTTSPSGNK